MQQEIAENSCSCEEGKSHNPHEEIWPPGPRTNDIYRTCGLPLRFMYPSKFQTLPTFVKLEFCCMFGVLYYTNNFQILLLFNREDSVLSFY